MDWIVSKKKYDFIGKRSLYRSDTMREDRKQLVGLLTDDPKVVLEEGAQIVSELNKNPVEMLGHVTSSYFFSNIFKINCHFVFNYRLNLPNTPFYFLRIRDFVTWFII